MKIYIDRLFDQHINAIKMLEKMKLMYTKNEPGAKQVNEPKAKPYYTEFMFIDDELFEELLDPDYKLYDEIQDICKPEEGWYGQPKYCYKNNTRCFKSALQ